jgi:excisionase family DNA binding protein
MDTHAPQRYDHDVEPAAPRLLRVPEACERLRLSRGLVYQLIAAGELRVVHFGRAVRVPVEAIDELIARRLEDHGPDDAA